MSCTTGPSVTWTYKRIKNPTSSLDMNVDVYPPSLCSVAAPAVPAVIYFHGGGLTVGNRKSWFPFWLRKRVTAAGYAFLSADYQLVPPATGHDIISDIRDLLEFVVSENAVLDLEPSSVGSVTLKIDPEAIVVAGSSAGGLCAYLAAMHCTSPRPKAVISLYGMGGDFFVRHSLVRKTKPFFRGREILDPKDFLPYLHPIHVGEDRQLAGYFLCESVVDSPLAYHPQTYHIPGYPANPRMLLNRLYLQLGITLDYYTGSFEDGGLSARLRKALGFEGDLGNEDQHSGSLARLDDLRPLIPPQHLPLFPQFAETGTWPPTMLVHGTRDTAVPVETSRFLAAKLRSAGVKVQVRELDAEHSFDCEPGAEEAFFDVFDAVIDFLQRQLQKA